jgi:hypothetical protein
MRIAYLDYVMRGNLIIPLIWATDHDLFFHLVDEVEAGRYVMKNVPRRRRKRA